MELILKIAQMLKQDKDNDMGKDKEGYEYIPAKGGVKKPYVFKGTASSTTSHAAFEWLRLLEAYFLDRKITSNVQRKNVMISLLQDEALIWSSAEDISGKATYQEMRDAFLEEFAERPVDALAKFYSAVQEEGETPSYFLAKLKRFAIIAKLDISLPENLQLLARSFDHGLDPELKRYMGLNTDLKYQLQYLKKNNLMRIPRKSIKRRDKIYHHEKISDKVDSSYKQKRVLFMDTKEGTSESEEDSIEETESSLNSNYETNVIDHSKVICKNCNTPGHSEDKCWKNTICELCNMQGHPVEVCRLGCGSCAHIAPHLKNTQCSEKQEIIDGISKLNISKLNKERIRKMLNKRVF